MSEFSVEEIAGYYIEGGELVCPDCLSDDERNELTMDQVCLFKDLSEDKLYFCDRCEKQIATS